MIKTTMYSQPYWKTYRVKSNKKRWFYTDRKIEIEDMPWFNKHTCSITVLVGYETEENSTLPIVPFPDEVYYVSIEHQIANYFGDTSGMHFRHKDYVMIDRKLYKQDSEGSEVVRITKELRGVLDVAQNIRYNI